MVDVLRAASATNRTASRAVDGGDKDAAKKDAAMPLSGQLFGLVTTTGWERGERPQETVETLWPSSRPSVGARLWHTQRTNTTQPNHTEQEAALPSAHTDRQARTHTCACTLVRAVHCVHAAAQQRPSLHMAATCTRSGARVPAQPRSRDGSRDSALGCGPSRSPCMRTRLTRRQVHAPRRRVKRLAFLRRNGGFTQRCAAGRASAAAP